jgi:hypothetical protein
MQAALDPAQKLFGSSSPVELFQVCLSNRPCWLLGGQQWARTPRAWGVCQPARARAVPH